ncbi:biotin-dependent carboxyltransferase family protein [Phycicoccus sp. CSK15P-2]|uniref:5-oxoprolinase subunit C family protein n=1 Tax=Phycicoccus sp. CSK15P-2 TaxID=2807627 RepID=UPI00194EFBAE|nr:biotin-dependent carboxyltransferase family protein [Phycicoccus sp. CSK15P-2]MBM6405279.1 biotin-dependent carboxyltransferase family protein [Phycicoccus sp. CSK15P-2]
MSATLTVRGTGPLALVEDLGRPGLAGVGVGRSGAADRGALRQANRVLGNDEGAAAVEVTAGGLDVEVGGEGVTLCVTGAVCEVTVDGRAVGSHGVVRVPAGSRVRLTAPRDGLRCYLGVRGGLDVPAVLGSRSHDVLAHLGPSPLAEGTVLRVGSAERPMPGIDHVPWPRSGADVVLRAVRGPRDGWVRDADVLTTATWTATDRSNRVGMRLAGAAFEQARDEQLPSEGVWRGAVQVPPSGEPVLFLADHPVTGGYPVVAVVLDEDVDRAAQVRPGESVSFRWVEAP